MISMKNKRRSRIRRIVVTALIVFTAGLTAIHLRYSLPYVYKVLVYQEPHYSDIHRFPARSIAESGSPSELPAAPDPRVAQVLELHPDVEELGAFLEETETTAFLVVHKGQLVEERYLRDHNHESVQNTFSVSKSIMSALVGLALRDGVLELDAPITRFLPELGKRDERFAGITVESLLDMRSGIRYSGDVTFPFVTSDDPLIYYHPDLESIVLGRTSIASEPGTFQYNNYNPPLIGLILRRTTGLPVSEYLERELWQPLGAVYAAGWTVDDHGFERMESGFHARGRDLARFGLLYLTRGVVADRRILPEEWVLASTDLPGPWDLERFDGRVWGYRAGWWIVPRSEGPSDFCAIGHFGQFIYISPQFDVVFVRNGPGRGNFGDRDWTELFHFAAERL
jgi:CubicO group peptidase (beta-lactamase class C family)